LNTNSNQANHTKNHFLKISVNMTSTSLDNGFTRNNPSARYTELVAYYQDMHLYGDPAKNSAPEETFEGRSLFKQVGNIKYLVDMYNASTLLDYGAGKGSLYEKTNIPHPNGTTYPNIAAFWGLESITCYDPAYLPFSTFPEGEKFDAVISTDVLEHCPEEDLTWIIDEIFSAANKFVFVNVACHPAERILPNGENAHCTVHEPKWWRDLYQNIGANYPNIRFHIAADLATKNDDGSYAMKEYNFNG
jgi:hypothetical protein